MAFTPPRNYIPATGGWVDEITTWEQVEPVTFNYVQNLNAANTMTWTNTEPIIFRYNPEDALHGQVTAVKPEVKMAIECCCGDPADPYWDHEVDECTWREPANRSKPQSTPTITVNTAAWAGDRLGEGLIRIMNRDRAF